VLPNDKKDPPNGAPSLPFYRPREGPGVHEGVRVLRLRLSPVLQAGVTIFGHGSLSVTGPIGRRRHLAVALHPFLACGMVNRSHVWSRTGIEQHSAGPPDTVADVSV
jgi:hypothetical protein